VTDDWSAQSERAEMSCNDNIPILLSARYNILSGISIISAASVNGIAGIMKYPVMSKYINVNSKLHTSMECRYSVMVRATIYGTKSAGE
jgi:hypothetical protein